MIKYWPTKQSIKLNYCVASLLKNTNNKFHEKLYNKTRYYLFIDLLNEKYKKELFILIIKKLEKLILYIIEINLTHKKLKTLKIYIINSFIQEICQTLTKQPTTNETKQNKSFAININQYQRLCLNEYSLLTENLLIYLIFGSAFIEKNLFIFNQFYTPYKHVQVLLETFIIQTSEIIIEDITTNIDETSTLIKFLKDRKMANHGYLSARSLALFFNNIYWQNYIKNNILIPTFLYNSYCKIWLIGSKGIISKYIYIHRLYQFQNLSLQNNLYLFLIELKDLIIPKTEKLIIQIIKYILDLVFKLINNFITFIAKIMISCIRKIIIPSKNYKK